MHATGPYRPNDPHTVAEQVRGRLAIWDAPAGRAGLWAMSAAEYVTGADAEWTLEYDGALGLVSFEVWQDGRRLFGLDDWVG